MSKGKVIFRVNPTVLEGKQGILPKDDKGRYIVMVGAYNAKNTSGDKYVFTQQVKNLFSKSVARTRCADKQLYGEADHPELSHFRNKTRSFEEAVAMYMDRLWVVPTKNQAHQIHDFWFEELPDRVDGQPVYGVFNLISPINERQRASLENPEENTAYSVRSFIDKEPSRLQGWLVETTELITWDWVTNPGISYAGKYNTPGLESQTLIEFNDGMDVLINDGVFRHLQKMQEQHAALNHGVESDNHVMLTTMIKDRYGFREVPDLGATLSRQWDLEDQ